MALCNLDHALAVFVVVLIPAIASANPVVGEVLPAMMIEDGAGHARGVVGALPVVLVLEDERSSKNKQPAHGVVGRYSDNPANRSIFEFVAVADLERWNWWPAKGKALASIQKTSAKESTPVLLDWRGVVKKTLGAHKAETTFAVITSDGRLRFLAQGRLDAAQQRALDDAIHALGAQPAPGR